MADAKKLYALSDGPFLEDKLEESTFTKLKNMPYISKKSVNEIKREDIMGEDELKIYSLIEDLEALDKKEKLWEEHKELEFNDLDE